MIHLPPKDHFIRASLDVAYVAMVLSPKNRGMVWTLPQALQSARRAIRLSAGSIAALNHIVMLANDDFALVRISLDDSDIVWNFTTGK